MWFTLTLMISTEYGTDNCREVIGGRAAPPRDHSSRTVGRKWPKSRRGNGWWCTRLAPSTAVGGAEPRSETMPRMAHVGGRRRAMVEHRAHLTQKRPNCITHSCLGFSKHTGPKIHPHKPTTSTTWIVQRLAKVLVHGLVKFVPALA